ncbi:hypothetical protein LAT59_00350, partial [Candidatus Gracilibacteria bacterium]|nr:hypothetical protein [Candidatus Gracilibacteria bacterium]
MKKITKKQLQSFIEQLEKLTHLSPSTEVDAFFQAICSYSVKNNEKIPSHPDVTRLQQACATGECFMEKSIAEQIISSENPWNTL